MWGKTDATDIRVMTWNVEDGICRTANKTSATGSWAALARITAAMKPDVLIIQEAGDNAGNGTGSGVDSVANMTTVVDLFLHGGSDPFNGGSVAEFVQQYAPSYDLPFVFVSTIDDGFNRNIILSRWPFLDLNGDNRSTYSNFTVGSNATPIDGGTGGIRGFQFAEIDLPNETYVGDLVIGNGHLKAGGTSGDFSQRLDAAQNIWYFVRYWYNGNGTGNVDPENAVSDIPIATSLLDANTPVIMGGDLNEDEETNGRNGPAFWMAYGPTQGDSTTGVDTDGSDGIYDASTEFFSGDPDTQGSSKLDSIIWQDTIATRRRSFIFQSAEVPLGSMPPEIANFGFPPAQNGAVTSTFASDHFPVIADFIVPLGSAPTPGEFNLLTPADGATKVATSVLTTWQAADDADFYEIIVATDPGLTNVVYTTSPLPSTSAIVFGLNTCTHYYWQVRAHNANGYTESTPSVATFTTIGYGDQNNDGIVTPADFSAWVANFNANNPLADVNQDGSVTPADFSAWVAAFNNACP
ncbi:MAG: hypothetical protein H6808_03145 [Phycisphaera sp.]|nr:hypothetical protein [Phycisphaera sp.]